MYRIKTIALYVLCLVVSIGLLPENVLAEDASADKQKLSK